jgi:hypothetical protein
MPACVLLHIRGGTRSQHTDMLVPPSVAGKVNYDNN